MEDRGSRLGWMMRQQYCKCRMMTEWEEVVIDDGFHKDPISSDECIGDLWVVFYFSFLWLLIWIFIFWYLIYYIFAVRWTIKFFKMVYFDLFQYFLCFSIIILICLNAMSPNASRPCLFTEVKYIGIRNIGYSFYSGLPQNTWVFYEALVRNWFFRNLFFPQSFSNIHFP